MEKTAQAHFGDLAGDAVFVNSDASPLNGMFTEIRAEDLHGYFNAHLRQHFYQRDGVRVGFFTGGTSGHPDAHGIGTGAVSQYFGIDGFAEAFENLGIAEEAGDVDENVAI